MQPDDPTRDRDIIPAGSAADSDPRDAPIERFGNEEDPISRAARRVYAEEDLPERLEDDTPYDRPGYEPEAGRPGGRENVDLQAERRAE